MGKEIFLAVYNQIPSEFKTVVLIVGFFVAYKLGYKIPWIPLRRKNHDGCPMQSEHNKAIYDAVEETKIEVKRIYDDAIKEMNEQHIRDREEDKKRAIDEAKITKIKKITMLDEQMNKVSIKQARIMTLMNSSYFEINKNKSQCESYENLLLKEKSIIKTMIRQWLRLNGYAEMSGDKWYNYKKEHKDVIVGGVSEFLDKFYDDDFYSIPRDVLKKQNFAKIVDEVLKIYDEMFDECRDIAIKWYKVIKEIEDSI